MQAFEIDPEVILGAVMRRSAHLKTYQLGPHAALTQKLLNEVSAAKVCLLDPQRKAAYDARLRKELAAREKAARVQVLPTAEPLPAPAVSAAAPIPAQPAEAVALERPAIIPVELAEPAIETGLDDLFADIQQGGRSSGASAIAKGKSRRPEKGNSSASPRPYSGEGPGVRASGIFARIAHRGRG